MKVFVVFHADIEDDRYVRMIFLDEAMAEEACFLDETKYAGDYRRTHSDICCYVAPFDLLDEWPKVLHGPEQPPPPRERSRIDDMMDDMLRQMLTRQFPAFERFRRLHPPEPAAGEVYEWTKANMAVLPVRKTEWTLPKDRDEPSQEEVE